MSPSYQERDLLHAGEFLAMLAFVGAVVAAEGVSLYVVGRWALLPQAAPSAFWDAAVARGAAAAVVAAGFVAAVWVRFIEPRLVRTTRVEYKSPKIAADAARAVRIVLLSDLHVENGWHLERTVARRVGGLRPDWILLGGDYLNDAEPGSCESLVRLVRSLAECAPVLAVLGNADRRRPAVASLLASAGARVLPPEAADVKNAASAPEPVEIAPDVRLWGVGWLDDEGLDRARARLDRARLNICFTHAPGLIPAAARAGFDLYICGHTHGGQVRLPFYGALLTLAVHGKRFECGRYELESGEGEGVTRRMTAYVTRGLGLEGGLATRVRFLCPPEVVIVELVPEVGEA